MNSFLLMFVLSFAVLIGTSFYIFRKRLDDMHGMMVAMGLGMVSGLLVATLYLIPTGNFLYGTMLGSFTGLAFGIIFGRLGGHMGILEGVMAGPMGGMMGAMLGQMIRPFSIEIFMPFFMFIFLISLLSLCYSVHCGCCGSKPKPVSKKFIGYWFVACVVLLFASVVLSFPLVEAKSESQELRLPAFLQQNEERAVAELKGGVQEVMMKIENSLYSPNVLVFKKGIPAKIIVDSTATAGCGAEIVIPEFKIKKIVAAGTEGVIEFLPENVGTFKFSCSMDMSQGKIVVEG